MLRVACSLLATLLLQACSPPQAASQLTFERTLDRGPSFSAYLASYSSADLKIHALVAIPKQDMPDGGFPLLIANHGYVPDPQKYGITSNGVDSRPGDYYRSIPELFTSRGFIVVLPDYRGHNSSEGLEFVDSPDAIDYYAADVLALLSVIGDIEPANSRNLFLWSHSMGGGVSMRVQLASDRIIAASYWATMSVDDLAPRFKELDGPIIIQHSKDDTSTPYSNSASLAAALELLDHPHVIHGYGGADHLFTGDDLERAADRDAAFFSALMP